MDTTITKQDLLSELARRSHLAQEIGDWHASETYVAAWHRVHAEPEPAATGQHGCGCPRCVAARHAAVPLDQRIGAASVLAYEAMRCAAMADAEEACANGGTARRHTH